MTSAPARTRHAPEQLFRGAVDRALRAVSGARAAAECVVLFTVVAVVFLASPNHQLVDSRYAVLLSEHVLRNHRPYLDSSFDLPADDVTYPLTAAIGLPYQIEVARGHVYYWYPPGSSLLSLPFVAFANAVGVSALAPDGSYVEAGEQQIEAVVAAVVAAGEVVLLYLLARLFLRTRYALALALVAAFGTQLWSTLSRTLWSHTWETFLLALVLLLLAGHRLRGWPLHGALLGGLAAWLFFVRPTGALTMLTVAAYLAVAQRHSLVSYALNCALWLGAFVAYSLHAYGWILPSYYLLGSSFDAHILASGLAGLLFSPSRGIIVFVPSLVIVAILVGRALGPGPARLLIVLALANIFVQLFALAGWWFWWGGASYGPRLLSDLVPWFVLLTAIGLSAQRDVPRFWRPYRSALAGVLVLWAIAVHARGALAVETFIWNYFVTQQSQLWDLRYPQFLAGLVEPPSEWLDPRNLPGEPHGAIAVPRPGAPVRGSTIVRGWAIDRLATPGSGIDEVLILLDGQQQGVAEYGLESPDVATYYAARRFDHSGWSYALDLGGVAAGKHQLQAHAHSTLTGRAAIYQITVNVEPDPQGGISAPGAENQAVSGPILVQGWAADRSSPVGTGVERVDLYVDGQYASTAAYGLDTPEVARYYANAALMSAGWQTPLDMRALHSGPHVLEARALSHVTGQWTSYVRHIVVAPALRMKIDVPRDGAVLGRSVVTEGWAVDLSASSGTGIDAVRIYLDGQLQGAIRPEFVRTDVAASLGLDARLQFGWSYTLDLTSVAPGPHHLEARASSTADPDTTVNDGAVFTLEPVSDGTAVMVGGSG